VSNLPARFDNLLLMSLKTFCREALVATPEGFEPATTRLEGE
jgi:hypothetical protein